MFTIGVESLMRVVQIGHAVREAGPEMQQRRGGLVRHPRIAVGRAGHHALEKAEDAAHALDPVERGDEMHFRRAGIAETHIDAARDQRPYKAFRSIHDCTSPFLRD